MEIPAHLPERLLRDESKRYVPYDDATGKPLHPGDTLQGKITIGIGRNLSDDGVSDNEINQLLDNDLQKLNAEISASPLASLFSGLDDPRSEALWNMAFNLGLHGLESFNTFLAFMKQGNFSAAADDLGTTKWAKQVGSRAIRIAQQIRSGEYQ